jgi:signal transduction histidine kinase
VNVRPAELSAGQDGSVGIDGSFWRAIAVFRALSLGYAALVLATADGYARPGLGWAVIGVMAAWTVVTAFAYRRSAGSALLVADLVVTVACLVSTPFVQGDLLGAPPVTTTWVAGPVLAWAVQRGRRAGVVVGAIVAAADLGLRLDSLDSLASVPVNGAVLLVLAGLVVGHVTRLARDAEERLRRATLAEAASRERERLARGIHDSVLQVLALVQRRGLDAGGEAAELGRLAGEQERALRALVTSGTRTGAWPDAGARVDAGTRPEASAPLDASARLGADARLDADAGAGAMGRDRVDLAGLLRRYGRANVTVSTAATPIPLPARRAGEIAAAVGAALDNVTRHCGPDPKAWVFAEVCEGSVIVSVRDDGPGIPDGRLPAAAAEGRLGIAQSIVGRARDLGGTASVVSTPGQGTEVELVVPLEGRP